MVYFSLIMNPGTQYIILNDNIKVKGALVSESILISAIVDQNQIGIEKYVDGPITDFFMI